MPRRPTRCRQPPALSSLLRRAAARSHGLAHRSRQHQEQASACGSSRAARTITRNTVGAETQNPISWRIPSGSVGSICRQSWNSQDCGLACHVATRLARAQHVESVTFRYCRPSYKHDHRRRSCVTSWHSLSQPCQSYCSETFIRARETN